MSQRQLEAKRIFARIAFIDGIKGLNFGILEADIHPGEDWVFSGSSDIYRVRWCG